MSGGGLRKRRSSYFVQVPRETIRNRAISFRARGVLSYLLDMPDGWIVKSAVVAAASDVRGDGREAIRAVFGELKRAGYYRLERRRLLSGQVVMGTAISEDAVPAWAAQARVFGKAPVDLFEQRDGSFKVRAPDGSLHPDDFVPEEPAPDTDGVPDDDPADEVELSTDDTGAQNLGPGTGAQEPGAGSPGAGFLGPLRETKTGEREEGGRLVGDVTTRARARTPVDNSSPSGPPPRGVRPSAAVPDVDPDDPQAFIRALREGHLRPLESSRPVSPPPRPPRAHGRRFTPRGLEARDGQGG